MANDLLDNPMKETELGSLPSEWEIAPLGDLATLSTGGTPSRERPEYWNGTIPWVKTGEVNYNVIRSTEEGITAEGMANSSARLYPPGTLLVAMYGQGITRGRVAILGIEATINQACAAVRVGNKIHTDFLFFAFKHQYEAIRDLGHGANQRNLNMLILRGVKFPVPPLAEQEAIAYVLRTVQQTKEATEKVIAAARQLKQSLMRHLFTYGPVPVEQADKVEIQESEEVGYFPASWVASSVDDVTNIQYGYRTSIPKTPPAKGTTIISTAEMSNHGFLNWSRIRTVEIPEHLIQRYTVHSGDILFNWRNSQEHIGKTALVEIEPTKPMVFASFILRIRTKEMIEPRFLHFLLTELRRRRVFFNQSRRAVNQANFNANELGALRVAYPDTETQREIVAALLAVDKKIETEVSQFNCLAALFRSLLDHLMTGKLRVNELEFPATVEVVHAHRR